MESLQREILNRIFNRKERKERKGFFRVAKALKIFLRSLRSLRLNRFDTENNFASLIRVGWCPFVVKNETAK